MAEMRVRSEITHVIPYYMRLLDAFINDRAQHRTNSPPQNACWLVCGTVCRLWRAVAEPACRPDARRRLPKRQPSVWQIGDVGRLDAEDEQAHVPRRLGLMGLCLAAELLVIEIFEVRFDIRQTACGFENAPDGLPILVGESLIGVSASVFEQQPSGNWPFQYVPASEEAS